MSGYIRASASASFVAVAAVAAAQTPAAPAAVATSRVVYIEVSPSEINRAGNALKTYRQATQKAPGAAHVDAVQQIGRPNLFAVHETWNDGGSLQAHLMSADNKKLRDDLQSARLSPIDDRVLASISTQPIRGAVTDDAIYVLTHADAAARREDIPGMLQELATGARRENGSILFDATVQPMRTNHFTIIEVWSDQKAYEAHLTAANTRKFREAFAPVSGALYDERIYRRVK
jgi:quinol monooxygenase YgiN